MWARWEDPGRDFWLRPCHFLLGQPARVRSPLCAAAPPSAQWAEPRAPPGWGGTGRHWRVVTCRGRSARRGPSGWRAAATEGGRDSGAGPGRPRPGPARGGSRLRSPSRSSAGRQRPGRPPRCPRPGSAAGAGRARRRRAGRAGRAERGPLGGSERRRQSRVKAQPAPSPLASRPRPGRCSGRLCCGEFAPDPEDRAGALSGGHASRLPPWAPKPTGTGRAVGDPVCVCGGGELWTRGSTAPAPFPRSPLLSSWARRAGVIFGNCPHHPPHPRRESHLEAVALQPV